MTGPAIGVVVVGFYSTDVWPEFFRSLSQSTLLPTAVVVIENSPEAPSGLSSLYSGPITLVHRPDNPGYGAAINQGVAALPKECAVIVMCNPDIVFEPDALSQLVTELESHAAVGIAGPAVVNPDTSIYPSARAFPGIRVGIGHAILGELWEGNPWTRKYLGVYHGSDTRVVDWLSGSCLAAKREAFAAVGGFDPGYFMFFEDVDLCFRLKREGWRSLYVPRARIEHSGGHATQPRMADMVGVHHESARRFLFRLYDKPRFWALRHILRIGLKVRALIAPVKYKNVRDGA